MTLSVTHYEEKCSQKIRSTFIMRRCVSLLPFYSVLVQFQLLASSQRDSGEQDRASKAAGKDQHSLCVPSFQEVQGFRGIHEHPESQNKESITKTYSTFCICLWPVCPSRRLSFQHYFKQAVCVISCVWCFGENHLPGGREYLCLRACQVYHCYPVSQQNSL